MRQFAQFTHKAKIVIRVLTDSHRFQNLFVPAQYVEDETEQKKRAPASNVSI